MAELITPSETVEVVERSRSVWRKDSPDSGFSFSVDANGQIIVTDGNRHNVAKFLSNPSQFIDEGIVEQRWSYHTASEWRCECGQSFYTEGGHDSECEHCGREYNASGQQLQPGTVRW